MPKQGPSACAPVTEFPPRPSAESLCTAGIHVNPIQRPPAETEKQRHRATCQQEKLLRTKAFKDVATKDHPNSMLMILPANPCGKC